MIKFRRNLEGTMTVHDEDTGKIQKKIEFKLTITEK